VTTSDKTVRNRPGTAPRQGGQARSDPTPYVILVFAGFCCSLPTALTLGLLHFPGLVNFLLFLAVTITPVLLTWAFRRGERQFSWHLPGQLRLAVVLAVLAGEICSVAVLVGSLNDHKRCVDSESMTVVLAVECQSQNGQNATDQWYYGGTGMQVGDQVQEGSLSPPAEDSGGGDNTGGDTGDDGGDDGGDGGGGDGGGGDG
jgi:hypothetical protein